eukprot:9238612-Alexandrium_andersonii.AAC.1
MLHSWESDSECVCAPRECRSALKLKCAQLRALQLYTSTVHTLRLQVPEPQWCDELLLTGRCCERWAKQSVCMIGNAVASDGVFPN